MRRCADLADCGFDNRDSELFCKACGLPLPYTALAGKYVVEALISKGGYAAVFRGIDQNLSRRIAIKVLLPSKTTPAEQDHFLREARIAAKLDHPNIAPILDSGKDGPSAFLVMYLYTAGSLRTRMTQVNGPLPAQETITNFHQLGSALTYAHTRQRPVIHRDIKPENILIHQEDRRLVVTDFGIARALEPGARVGKTITVRGTVGYMAPEQAQGIVDPRSDQFGCAVVLYEMLTGYHPLDPVGSSIPAPSTLNGELPTALDAVVLRAMAKRPEERYADMHEFVQHFDFASRSNPVMQQTPRPRNTPPARGVTPPPTSAMTSRVRGDSTGRQQAVRSNIGSINVRERCEEGGQFLEQQQYTQALQAFEDVLRAEPGNLYAWHGKGTALYRQGNYKKAFEAYQRATEIEPENPDIWLSAGMTLNRLQRYQQAIVHFERALIIDPRYIAAWNGKAEAHLGLTMPDDAVASYQQALTIDPNSFQAWNGLGNARNAVRDYAGAVEAYSQALLIHPGSVVAWCNKAEALMRSRNNRAALEALKEATELDRRDARAWTLMAEVQEALGNRQEAQKARKRAKPWVSLN